MPHITIEYSSNLEKAIQISQFIEKLHNAAAGTGVFPLAGIRTRAARRDDYRVGNGNPENSFIHVTARIGPGRDLPTKKLVGQTLFDAASTYLDSVFSSRPLALSLEIQELSVDLMFRKNNMH